MRARSKFGNIRSGRHASQREARRAHQLILLQMAGAISELREQVRYELLPPQSIDGKHVERAVHYVADFVYLDATGCLVVEDAKGFRTPDYVIKRKLMLFRHGIRIREV